ncbi:putative taste receptor type 2 member 33 [Erinaceus europaeus]|uniref:Taste receptor type 2 n=1 Tax=Erinaceus europaeus TaxID=9365 RepID=A0A1S2Z9D0_ERIEU|nr:putative taste receptor type 2 member 33 [Erinaceus europaeus]
MVSLLTGILYMIVIAEFVTGNVANCFIALVNCTDWVKRQKMSLVDHILTALALFRIGLLWTMLIYSHAVVFDSASYSLEVNMSFLTFSIISNHFSLWFATSLSIFYLFKIANFSGFVFLYLKWRIKKVLLSLMLGSLAILISQIAVEGIYDKMLVYEDEGNLMWKGTLKASLLLSRMTIFTLTNFIPFILSLIAFVLLIFSLGKHLWKMQFSGKGTRDASTQVHIRALQTVISFLLVFAGYFLTLTGSLWSFYKKQSRSHLLVCLAIEILCPSSHSFVLIWGNKKLKEAFLSFLWQLKCWLREKV